jgi:hypothetical protein
MDEMKQKVIDILYEINKRDMQIIRLRKEQKALVNEMNRILDENDLRSIGLTYNITYYNEDVLN